MTENGREEFTGTRVFTGSQSGGNAGANCFNWSTTSTNPVVVGRSNDAASWTDTGTVGNCTSRARVYCFQLSL